MQHFSLFLRIFINLCMAILAPTTIKGQDLTSHIIAL